MCLFQMFHDLRNNLKSSDSSLYECSISYSTLKRREAPALISVLLCLDISRNKVAITLDRRSEPLNTIGFLSKGGMYVCVVTDFTAPTSMHRRGIQPNPCLSRSCTHAHVPLSCL
jgi:hypothetical protein